MRSALSFTVRLLASPWAYVAAFGLMAIETAVAGASTLSSATVANGGPIAQGANMLTNGVVIPGAAAVTGTAMGTASVAYALDAQKQNIIKHAVGGALGGVVGVGSAVAVPPIIMSSAAAAQGALLSHASRMLVHVHSTLHSAAYHIAQHLR
jgi:hypothetical protein